MARVMPFMSGEDVLTAAEKQAEKTFDAFVQSSASYRTGRKRANDGSRRFLGDFDTLRKGNAIPEEQEYDSPLAELAEHRVLTRWESSVMARFWSIFRVVNDKPALQDGVTPDSAKLYVIRDLRTVKLRVALRAPSTPAALDIADALQFAMQYFK